MTKHADEFSQFTDSVACRECTLPRDENHLTRKVGFEGTPELDPCWKSQPVTARWIWSGNENWICEQTILTRGSEFLMDETSWSQTWSTKSTATTNRKPLKRRRKCLLLQADQRLKQNQEDLPLLEGFNTVLIRQDKKFFTSELFKVIRDAIPLILHHRTMCLFRTISSSTFLSYWMCSQFALHHKFRIDSGWTTF